MPETHLDLHTFKIKPRSNIAAEATREANEAKIVEKYKEKCLDIVNANNSPDVSSYDLLNVLKDWRPRFEDGFLLSTLQTLRNIDPYRNDYMGMDDPDIPNHPPYKIRTLKINLVNNNAQRLTNVYVETEDEMLKREILSLFNIQLLETDGFMVTSALEFFSDNYRDIKDSLPPAVLNAFFKKGLDWHQFRDEIKKDREVPVGESIFALAKKVIGESGSFPERKAAIMGMAEIQNGYVLSEDVTDYFLGMLEGLGVDGEAVLSSWQKNFSTFPYTREYPKYVFNNFNLMKDLENRRPGICRVLAKDFGIFNFARYPSDVLISQYDNRDKQIPYGVMIYSDADYNGAFSQQEDMLKSLFSHLNKLWYGLRIYEGSGRREIARALFSADKRYGKRHKISFAVFGGHGSPESIQFGDERVEKTGDLLTLSDIKNKHTGKLRRVFIEDPQVILIACSTGVENGIGSGISELGVDTTAPKVDTNISRIRVYSQKKGKLKIPVTYKAPDAAVQFPKVVNALKNE